MWLKCGEIVWLLFRSRGPRTKKRAMLLHNLLFRKCQGPNTKEKEQCHNTTWRVKVLVKMKKIDQGPRRNEKERCCIPAFFTRLPAVDLLSSVSNTWTPVLEVKQSDMTDISDITLASNLCSSQVSSFYLLGPLNCYSFLAWVYISAFFPSNLRSCEDLVS
jgi:hypothetical protein